MLFCDEIQPSRILGFASLSALKELGINFFFKYSIFFFFPINIKFI